MNDELAIIKNFLLFKYGQLKEILPIDNEVDDEVIWAINLIIYLSSAILVAYHKIVTLLILLLVYLFL